MNPEQAQGLSAELQAALAPLLGEIETLSERIREYRERMEEIAKESYPEVARLKQVHGVGTLIALTYVLTLEDAHRLGKSRMSGAMSGYNQDGGTRGKAITNYDPLTARNIRSARSSFFRTATFVTYLLRLHQAHNFLLNNWF